jgi:hypothetical protein
MTFAFSNAMGEAVRTAAFLGLGLALLGAAQAQPFPNSVFDNLDHGIYLYQNAATKSKQLGSTAKAISPMASPQRFALRVGKTAPRPGCVAVDTRRRHLTSRTCASSVKKPGLLPRLFHANSASMSCKSACSFANPS